LFAPAGTPPAIVEKLNAEVAKVLRAPGTKEAFDAQGLVPFMTTPAQFAEMLKRETANYAPVVKARNIRIDPN
ncbi:MAG: hypothetical protein CFE45_35925, partial [Burkholderiales bacterium PBB5]